MSASAQSSRYRWFVVGVFFFFMLLHQTEISSYFSNLPHQHGTQNEI